MRIIGGEYRSRRIESVPGVDVRPTPDRLRESLFNVLTPILADAVFVDAYAGSGSVGLEAISRGARKVLFLEKDKAALSVIGGNLKSLKVPGYKYAVLGGKAAETLETIEPAGIVFFDPPYDREKEYELCLQNAFAPIVIAQHSFKLNLPETAGRLVRYRQLKQGDNILSFYRPAHPLSPVQETEQIAAVPPDE